MLLFLSDAYTHSGLTKNPPIVENGTMNSGPMARAVPTLIVAHDNK